jgi:hypothetical protein
LLNNIKLGLKKILISNTHGGQSNHDTPESRMQNKALTCGFVEVLDEYGTLKARAYQRLTTSRLRLARGVALAIGIALCSATPAGMAQQMPQITPERYATFLIGELQTSCLFKIALKESNIRYDAVNRSSGALGAWQIMNPRVKYLSPLEQVEWAIRYAEHRYGSACDGWAYWKRNYWW